MNVLCITQCVKPLAKPSGYAPNLLGKRRTPPVFGSTG
jgi:hypothetical protein